MTAPVVLFSAPDGAWAHWAPPLAEAFADAGIDVDLSPSHPPAKVDYMVYAPGGAVDDFTQFPKLKVVFSLWAGVEGIVGNPTLSVPLTRMVDSGLAEGMTEWVVGHVLRHHLGTDAHVTGQDGIWRGDVVPPLARDRRVTVLGAGALGAASAGALAQLGFDVAVWSRSPKSLAGVRCYSGDLGFGPALGGAEIIVLLLPATARTAGIIGAEALAMPAPGAALINPGRGSLIDEEAVLAALGTGRLGHATLDVFNTEPLPPDHPFWAHPRVTVTPHIASATRTATAAPVIAENLRRAEASEPLLHLVDPDRGY